MAIHATLEPPGYRRSTRRLIVLLLVVTLLSSVAALLSPRPAEAYTWGAWTTRYYTATTTECAASRELASRFIGPIQYYSSACVFRVRRRTAVINDWAAPWTDRLLEIDNTAPYWNAWGMNLVVRVHWNGTVARHSPETLICKTYAFIIRTTQTDCKVFGNNSANLTARMAYDASWGWDFMSMNVNRGAQQSVTGQGVFGAVTKWP